MKKLNNKIERGKEKKRKCCLDRGAERRKTNQRKRKEKTLQRKTKGSES